MQLHDDLFQDERHHFSEQIKQIQSIQLRMLKYIDYICRQHNLHYWLDGGTLLGAVRHQGFIPWDDDIDIAMPREDFIKFIHLAKNSLPIDICLEIHTENGHYGDYHVPCKVRDKYTKIVEMVLGDESEIGKGISIDIIPIDEYSNNKFIFFFQKQIKKFYRLVCKIRNKSFHKNNYTDIFFGRVRFINSLIMFYFYTILLKLFLRYRKKNSSQKVGYGFDVFWTRIFDKTSIYLLVETDFCGTKFYVPSNVDAVLKVFYGNSYMTLPSTGNRVTHIKTLILDTRKNIEACCQQSDLNL